MAYYIGFAIVLFIGLILLSVLLKVVINLINYIVIGVMHGLDSCCISKMAPKDNDATAELIEIREKTIDWLKDSLYKVKLLKAEFFELRRRSKKMASIVHFPGV
uniref:Envelope stress response membrane protein PspC n=1 Tax=Panagrellus redivivus TaxID=6233 RepID=A0A7E4WDD0_PANRE